MIKALQALHSHTENKGQGLWRGLVRVFALIVVFERALPVLRCCLTSGARVSLMRGGQVPGLEWEFKVDGLLNIEKPRLIATEKGGWHGGAHARCPELTLRGWVSETGARPSSGGFFEHWVELPKRLVFWRFGLEQRLKCALECPSHVVPGPYSLVHYSSHAFMGSP